MTLPPKRTSKASALVWLAAIGLLLVVALALPVVLLREQALLFVEIWYHGVDHYPVVPVVPFPGPPVEATETFDIDGLKFSLPVGSVDYMTVGEELDRRLTVHLRDGMIVAIDPPIVPIPLDGRINHSIGVYAASPDEFSWGASVEETRRLRRALATKGAFAFADTATGASQVTRTGWQGYSLRTPSVHFMNWLPSDKSSTGMVWVHKPPSCDADHDALADVVFGSFDVVHPPVGTFDADVRRLAERFPAPDAGE
ncbi:MAG TPA: hypothetical protein VGN57_15670 [Pirellulaceae bacterium]|jgi:hypothetical protein|nr:hypothetical protein [Pirellulaceae bacterium]